MGQTGYASHFAPASVPLVAKSACGKADALKISVAELAHPLCVSSGEGRGTVMGSVCAVVPIAHSTPMRGRADWLMAKPLFYVLDIKYVTRSANR